MVDLSIAMLVYQRVNPPEDPWDPTGGPPGLPRGVDEGQLRGRRRQRGADQVPRASPAWWHREPWIAMVGTGSRNIAMIAMDENDEIINNFSVYIYMYAFICLVNTCSYWIILIRWVVWWCMYHYTSWWMVCKYRFQSFSSNWFLLCNC